MMKTYLKAFLVTLVMLVAGNSASYAAFPITHATTASIIEAGNTPAASVTATYEEPTPAASHAPARRIRGKSQAWALVICCFLGYLGIHRYYLGYILEGCIQTVTLGGMGVWWIIDLIRICTGDLQPKEGKYMAPF